MRTGASIWILFSFALIGCSEKESPSQREISGPAGPEVDALKTRDLSSPKLAFESVARFQEELANEVEDHNLGRFFFRAKFDDEKRPFCTQAFIDMHETKLKSLDLIWKEEERKPFAFKSSKTLENGDVEVEGAQITILKKRSDKTRKVQDPPQEVVTKLRWVFRKMGEEWRLVNQFENCPGFTGVPRVRTSGQC